MPSVASSWAFDAASATSAARITQTQTESVEVLVGEQHVTLQPYTMQQLASDGPLQIEELLAHSQSVCNVGAQNFSRPFVRVCLGVAAVHTAVQHKHTCAHVGPPLRESL